MLSSNTPHCTPLECGNLDISYSIDISILWIEERDSDQKVLLAERIIPTGIMGALKVREAGICECQISSARFWGGSPDRGVKILDNLLLLLYAFLMIIGIDVGLFNLA